MTKQRILALMILTALFGVAAQAADNVIYHSTLADAATLEKPIVGAAATVGPDGAPVFAEAAGVRGLRARGGANPLGTYRIPFAEWPAEAGTLSFWLNLPETWKMPITGPRSMPIVMGQKGKLIVQFDLREGSGTLGCSLGKTGAGASIVDWKANERHHVAIAWDAAGKRLNFYIDGVRMGRNAYPEPAAVTELFLCGYGRGQGNDVAVLSDLKIERGARGEFPEVPEALQAVQREKLTPKTFAGDASGLSLKGWKAEDTYSAELFDDIGGGVLAVRIESVPRDGIILRPPAPVAIAPTTLRFLADVAVGQTGRETKLVFLVKGDDGKEREVPSRQIVGRAWRQVVSDYAGGERVELNSMRPDMPHPRGEALPVALAGIKILPQRAGLVYLRNVEPSEIEYLKHRRWEMVPPHGELPFAQGMHPFGPTQPEVRLDWFLPEQPGAYKVQWMLTDVFQGPAVKSGEWQGEWNPADLDKTYGQRFPIELPGAGTYWLTLKTWADGGAFVNSVTLPVGVVRDTPHQPADVAWETSPRLDGESAALQVDTGVENHIFPDLASARIRLRLNAESPRSRYRVRLTVKDYSVMHRLTKPTVLEFAWNDHEEIMEMPLELPHDGAAYVLKAELLDADSVLDATALTIGVRRDFKPEPITIRQPSLNSVFGAGKVQMPNTDNIMWYASPNVPTQKPFEEHYQEQIELWQHYGATFERVDVHLANAMPLPGFFDLRSVHSRIELLRKAGMPYMLALASIHQHYSPAWMPFNQQEDMCGIQYVGHDSWARGYFAAPITHKYILQPLVKELYRHFGNDASFLGWVFWTDVMFLDHGRRRTDFSPAMQEYFSVWLNEVKGIDTLTKLNARYGTAITSWDEVDIPLPPPHLHKSYSAAAGRFDNPAWRDCWDFRMWVIKNLHADSLARYSRSLGDTRPWGFYSYSYGQEEEDYLEDLIELGCFTTLGTEGKPAHNFIRNKVLMPYYSNHAYMSEYQSFLPGFKHMAEKDCDRMWSTVMLTGGNNMNAAMFLHGQILPGRHKQQILLRGLERQRQWLPALREYAKTDIFPFEIACFSSGESGGMPVSGVLWPEYPNHMLKEHMSDAAFAEQKLIFIPPTYGGSHTRDFTPKMREKAVRYVMNGGRLVLVSPESAQYTRGDFGEQFALLRELGWRDTIALSNVDQGNSQGVPAPGGIFATAATFELQGAAPDIVCLPKDATVEASFASGVPAIVRWPVGKGEVILFVRGIDFKRQKSREYLADLLAWADVNRRVTAPCWFAYTHDNADTRYLMLYVEGKPVAERKLTVKVHDLPEGDYRVVNIGPDELDLGVKTAAQWREGVEIPLPNGMLVLKFTHGK